MLELILALICNECFHIKKNDWMICARNSQIMCKIKPKSLLRILGQGSGSWSLIFDPGFQVLGANPLSSCYKV